MQRKKRSMRQVENFKLGRQTKTDNKYVNK